MAETVRVLVVDDHEVLADALTEVLNAQPDLEVVGTANDLATARALLAGTPVDVVLLDHRLPDGEGVAAIPELHEIQPGAAIVMLTAMTADSVLLAAIENGAAGFISKTHGVGEVTAAVRSAAGGESVISPDLLVRLLPRFRQEAHPAAPETELTGREHDILGHLAEGMSNAAIAGEMGVSVHTVRNHLANISAKLGAHSRLEVLSIAMKQGLLDRP